MNVVLRPVNPSDIKSLTLTYAGTCLTLVLRTAILCHKYVCIHLDLSLQASSRQRSPLCLAERCADGPCFVNMTKTSLKPL